MVGTVKKSIAAIASLWLCRKLSQHLAGSESLGACGIHRETVRSDTANPSIRSSPCIRGAPQVEVSATIRKIRSRISLEIFLLPIARRALEIVVWVVCASEPRVAAEEPGFRARDSDACRRSDKSRPARVPWVSNMAGYYRRLPVHRNDQVVDFKGGQT